MVAINEYRRLYFCHAGPPTLDRRTYGWLTTNKTRHGAENGSLISSKASCPPLILSEMGAVLAAPIWGSWKAVLIGFPRRRPARGCARPRNCLHATGTGCSHRLCAGYRWRRAEPVDVPLASGRMKATCLGGRGTISKSVPAEASTNNTILAKSSARHGIEAVLPWALM